MAIFVDGDFWHGNQWISRGLPSLGSAFIRNQDYRVEKITRNVARDDWVNDELAKLGWTVVRIWASDIDRDAAAVAEFVAEQVRLGQPADARLSGRRRPCRAVRFEPSSP